MTEEDAEKTGQYSIQTTSIEVNVISISVPSSHQVSFWSHFNKRRGGRLKKFLLRRSISATRKVEKGVISIHLRYCVLNYIL